MTPQARSTTTSAVIDLLSEADHFNRLAKLRPGSSRRYYAMKDAAAEKAIQRAAAEFCVDSVRRGADLIVGVTHQPSGRRLHLRPYMLSGVTQLLLYRMALAVGMPYPLLRWDDQGHAAGFNELAVPARETLS